VGNDVDTETLLADVVDREADAVHADGALDGDVALQGGRDGEGQPHGAGVVPALDEGAGAVHVSADEMAAQRRRRRQGAFQVDPIPLPKGAEGGTGEGLGGHVGVKTRGHEIRRGQADAAHAHRIADADGAVAEELGIDAQSAIVAVLLDGADASGGLDDAREHARDYALLW
jgi:hypothetical protein